MAKITTDHCRKFLADFFARNPQIINALFDGNEPDDLVKIHDLVANEKNWKRIFRCGPGRSDYTEEASRYVIYKDGVIVNRYAEPSPLTTMPISGAAVERGFVCAEDELEDSVKYIVVETTDGKLILGDYIGD